jgi:Cof subfamily protein (haloacid dehalogenase superfamily)
MCEATMNRALAIDLDGTLLVGEEVPEANVRAVRAARDAGYRIIIATARWKQMALRIADTIGIEGPVIACSGAQVYVPDSARDIFDHRLPGEFVPALYRLCDSERCVATITVSDRVLLKLDGAPDLKLLPPEMHWVKQLTGADDSLPRVAAIQGTAINVRIRRELEPRFKEIVHVFDSIGPTGKLIVTITAKAASKGAALRAACEHLGVAPRDVVAFGDAENDIEMFRVAGRSVAMGQASDAVKSAATAVTGRNDEAGVARAIDHLLATGSVA